MQTAISFLCLITWLAIDLVCYLVGPPFDRLHDWLMRRC